MKWSDIPLMFSSVLGQVLPGAVILILAFATMKGPILAFDLIIEPGAQQRVFSFGFSVTFLIAAYALGMIVGQLWTLTIGPMLKELEARTIKTRVNERLVEHEKLLTAMRLPELRLHAENLPAQFVMCDHLHLCAPEQALRMVKLRAETRYCHVVAIGAIILATVNPTLVSVSSVQERSIWEIFLLVIAAASIMRSHRLVGFATNGITTTWLSMASAKGLPFQSVSRDETEGQETAGREG